MFWNFNELKKMGSVNQPVFFSVLKYSSLNVFFLEVFL